jgi:hypothetical protein
MDPITPLDVVLYWQINRLAALTQKVIEMARRSLV